MILLLRQGFNRMVDLNKITIHTEKTTSHRSREQIEKCFRVKGIKIIFEVCAQITGA